MNNEIWKAIPGFDDYEASSLGRVRSIDSVKLVLNRCGFDVYRHRKGMILKPRNHTCGYHTYILSGKRTAFAHRLIALAFHGEPESDSLQVAHLNGVKIDNRPDNLKWTTVSENHSHKIIHGTNLNGEKNPRSILNDDCVKDIMMRYSLGEKSIALAEEYGVTFNAILNIVSGRGWSHIESEHRAKAKEMTKHNMNYRRTLKNAQV